MKLKTISFILEKVFLPRNVSLLFYVCLYYPIFWNCHLFLEIFSSSRFTVVVKLKMFEFKSENI